MINALLNLRALLAVLADEAMQRLQPGPIADEYRPARQHLEAAPATVGEVQREARGVAGHGDDRRGRRGGRGVDHAAASSHALTGTTGCHPACPCGVDLDPSDGVA